MHLKDDFTRKLEENVFFVLALGIDLHIQISKQAILFYASVSLCMCPLLAILVPYDFASLTPSHLGKLSSDVTSSVKSSLIGLLVGVGWLSLALSTYPEHFVWMELQYILEHFIIENFKHKRQNK